VIDEEEKSLSLADERIERAIVKMGAKLLILDPLQAYLGGADIHSVNGVRPLMKRLTGVAARTGCAVVIIGHLNKRGGKSQYRGLGSIDIFAAARSVLTVGPIPEDKNMRAVVHNKSNLAPAGASVAFGLDTDGRFVWLGDYDITIDELLRDQKKPPESQFTKARQLIEAALANGAVPAADMEQMAEEQGISPKTLRRAKSALGVISVKRGGGWYWEFPIEAEFTVCDERGQQGQDGHDSPVTALTIFPGRDAQEDSQQGHSSPMTTFHQSGVV
jgi:hypothetical protein